MKLLVENPKEIYRNRPLSGNKKPFNPSGSFFDIGIAEIFPIYFDLIKGSLSIFPAASISRSRHAGPVG